MSEREAARQFGLARETVRKMLRYSVPPGYRRQQPVRRPKLDQWVGVIAAFWKKINPSFGSNVTLPSESSSG